MTYRTKLPLFLLPTLVIWASVSFAQDATECSTNADCEEGSLCEKGSSSGGCEPNAECDPTVHEEEFGRCVVQPTECEAEDDCGEYLTCSSSESGVCWSSTDGDSGCSEPDPEAPKYCAPKYTECSEDSDCPREFECLQNLDCPAIACAEGTDCEQPACSNTGGQCFPKQVECDDDSVCPSDWSCIKNVQFQCSGGGVEDDAPEDDGGDEPVSPTQGGSPDGEPADGDSADFAPSPDPIDPGEEPNEGSCTEVVSQGYCQPDGWGGVFYGVDSGAESPGTNNDGATKGESDADESDSGASSDAGGCSVHPAQSGSPGSFGWLALLAAPLILGRRRMFSQRI